MLLTEKKEFSKELRSLMAVYFKPAEPEIFSAWWNAFEEYPFEDVKTAFSLYIRKVAYPPTPSGVMQVMTSKIHEVLAEEAWNHVPKSESESGYVTKRMMRALGVAEESLAIGDNIGARIAFIKTYNSISEDNDFYYSQAYGVPYEEKDQRKIDDYRLLENKGWMTQEKMLMLKPKQLLMIENGSERTQIESNKSEVTKLRLITSEMLNSKKEVTSQE